MRLLLHRQSVGLLRCDLLQRRDDQVVVGVTSAGIPDPLLKLTDRHRPAVGDQPLTGGFPEERGGHGAVALGASAAGEATRGVANLGAVVVAGSKETAEVPKICPDALPVAAWQCATLERILNSTGTDAPLPEMLGLNAVWA